MMKDKGKYLFNPEKEFKDLDLGDFREVLDAFCRRIEIWYFEPLEKLLTNDSGLFIAAAVQCMLVDTFAGYLYGFEMDTQRMDFERLMKTEFGFNSEISEAFYRRIRCGILHQTYVKEKSCITTEPEFGMLQLQNNVLFFKPREFYGSLRLWFIDYVSRIKRENSTELKFRTHFKYLFAKEYSPEKWTDWNNQTTTLKAKLR